MKRVIFACVALCLSQEAWAQVFQSTTPGLYNQTVVEQQFLNALGIAPQLIDFEDLPTGAVASNQYAFLGVTLPTTPPAQPLAPGDGSPLIIGNDPYAVAHSGARWLGVSTDGYSENLTIQFSPAVSSIALWIIDQEFNPNGVDRITVLSASGVTLVDVPNPTNGYAGTELGAQGNMFFGYISSTPIGSVRLIESTIDNDGVGIDDVRFVPIPPPTYPGTGDGLTLGTGVGGSVMSLAPFDVKSAAPGQLVEISIWSLTPAFYGTPFVLGVEFFTTGGTPPSAAGFGLPQIHLSLVNTLFVVGAIPGLGAVLLPDPFFNFAFTAPGGFGGTSLMIQGAVVTPAAANGIFAASDAHEIRFL